MSPIPGTDVAPVVRLRGVSLRYRKTEALKDITLDLPAGCMVGLIGPDGVGKSSLLSLISGARMIQQGQVDVLGGDMADRQHRLRTCPRIAYMPQGLGKNLYPTLSVYENVDFFGRLFGHGQRERERRIHELLESTGLAPFANRPAGKLSGGMKQKLGLCCALIHDPELLILDEPTTGVDPLSRREFWSLVDRIRARQQGMSVVVATAYMEEAARFDTLVAMNAGEVLATGTPEALLQRTETQKLEEAFIALLPEAQRQGHQAVVIPPRIVDDQQSVAIEATDLTMRFGDFVAVDHVNFQINRGEIFGFLGSNGCGKTTTMKMLTGLLPASDGSAKLFGNPVNSHDIDTRRRVGYMTQAFSLYGELSVRQNLLLHARLFKLPEAQIPGRMAEMAQRFELNEIMDTLPGALPLGQRQRLSLAVAMIHKPEMLILDEPTSGVDPVARDAFWQMLADLARNDQVTIFISTHFMNEAERCDRISLMHAGRVLVSDTPKALVQKRGTETLEEAFIAYLEDARAAQQQAVPAAPAVEVETAPSEVSISSPAMQAKRRRWYEVFNPRRMLSYAHRELLELIRDPIRMTLASAGSVMMMLVLGYGINMDVEDLTFAVLDYDQTSLSRDYALDISGSRYFIEKPPLQSYEDMDRRMRNGEISLAIEIPPDFARDLRRGRDVAVAAWIDGSMPTRATTINGYVEGMHNAWLTRQMRELYGDAAVAGTISVETRYRYNPDVASLPAMVPAVIPLLLLLIPAILSTLAVVREKEMGSILNLYVTPVTRLEFLIGKQLPYIGLAMISFLILTAMAIWLFDVPLTGSLTALTLGAFLYVICATAMGQLVSTAMSSQTAAVFGTSILTLLPARQFCGMLDPVTSLEGAGRLIGSIYPTTYFLNICRGAFSKALSLSDLQGSLIPLAITVPVLITLSAILLKKQER